MNIISNFRYGEISRKCAGRFDSEFYNQGAFEYTNLITGAMGEACRRPPLKTMLEADILDIREFTISRTNSYILGFGKTSLYLYRFVGGKFQQVDEKVYPHKENEPAIVLDRKKAREIRICQYFTRMYFVHHTFRPFYADLNPLGDGSMVLKSLSILLNQDGKDSLLFTPMYVEDASGKEIPNMESRVVYERIDSQGVKSYWFDKDSVDENDKYPYSATYPPLKGNKTYIQNYEDPQDDALLSGEGNFPSEVACINDCLYLAATDINPQVVWKSRVLGSSQYIDGFIPDSMHDFITFQTVQTEGRELVDASKFPKTNLTGPNGEPINQTDENGNTIYYGKPNGEDEVRVYYELVDGQKVWFTDPEFKVPYEGQTPYPKAIEVFDVSDPNKLLTTVCRVDFVATDSCGDRIEFNSGRLDKIMYIRPSCGKIIVGTTSGEETLPADFSPVSNRSREHYSDYGTIDGYNIAPVCMDSSFFFLQQTNVLREMFLYQGFISKKDISMTNHEILSGEIASINSKNVPTPQIYIVKEDGSMVVLTYDKDNGIQAFSRWNSEGNILATANMQDGGKNILLALVEYGKTVQICRFDEEETETYEDIFTIAQQEKPTRCPYVSRLVTPYIEIIDNQFLGFGSFKKANTAYVRCYDTGHIEIGDDDRQLVKSSYPIGSKDYKYTLKGTAQRQYSVIIQSVGSEPMNILAFGFEVMK